LHPQSHLILSWGVGHRLAARRDRVLVAWAGMAPDLDGLTLLAGEDAYGRWHHLLTHGLAAALLFAVLASSLGREKLRVAMLALLAFHLHLVCDLLGSGREWGIVYFYPVSAAEYHFTMGWPLASWQNVAITAAALAACAWIGITRGRTFLEACAPRRLDEAVVETLRARLASFVRGSARPVAGRSEGDPCE